jgi:mycothiol synthase
MRRNEPDLCVQKASLEDQVEALQLALSQLSDTERAKQVEQYLASSAGGPPEGLWVGFRGKKLVAAVLAQVQPGRTVVVSLPQVTAGESSAVARELLQSVVDNLSRQDVQIAQMLLETDHGPAADLLIACGFRHASNLLYLVSVQGSFPTSLPHDGLEFALYSADERQRLARLVERSYEGSLDCPEVDGLRRIDDVLDGYQATGEFDPTRWFIVRQRQSDIGCLLLADHPQFAQWELIYMGLIPEARGRGWGVAMVRHAQWLTGQAGRKRLVLAVDAANAPALAVYASAGFVAWDHRSVYLRNL